MPKLSPILRLHAIAYRVAMKGSAWRDDDMAELKATISDAMHYGYGKSAGYPDRALVHCACLHEQIKIAETAAALKAVCVAYSEIRRPDLEPAPERADLA